MRSAPRDPQPRHRHARRATPRAMHPRRRLSPLMRAIAALGLVTGLPHAPAQTAPSASALPTGAQVQAGQASITTQGAQMTVRNTPGAIVHWQSFNIGAGAGVHFDQAGAASRVLNRVVGHDPSQIFGALTSNGQVWLLNPHGVLFGAGARVDVAGLVASTLRLNDNDFLAGRLRFAAADGDAPATLRNEGVLTSTEGGRIVLLGQRVENTGEVHTPGGQAALVAGRTVELVDTDLPNLVVRLREGAGDVYNAGRIHAPAGRIDLQGAIVNHDGIVRADTLAADAEGRIVLRAAGTLTLGANSVTAATASGDAGRGGAIDLLGEQVALVGRAQVDVSGAAGGGSVRVGGGEQGRDASVPNARAVYIGSGAELRADASGARGDGGRIIVWADEATRAYGRFSARGGSAGGNGGFVETSGGWLDAHPAAMDLGARFGQPGQWLLDPYDLEIVEVGQDIAVAGGTGPVFTSTGARSTLTTATLANALNGGADVRVVTGGGAQDGFGDITMGQPPSQTFQPTVTLSVAPPTPVTLTLEAGRDIVIGNGAAITSTGAPLSLVFSAGGAMPGAIRIVDSTITTHGGSVTLRGAAPTTLTLPDGSTVQRNVAQGRPGAQGPLRPGVEIHGATLDLGAGTLDAAGYSGAAGAGAGVRIHDYVGFTTMRAATIDAARIVLFGAGSAANLDDGVQISGGSVLTATQEIRIEGAGYHGVAVDDNARLALNAAAGTGASFTIVGRGGNGDGVRVTAWASAPGASVSVANATFHLEGHSVTGTGLGIFNAQTPVGPRFDLAAATRATFDAAAPAGGMGSGPSIDLFDVSLALPQAGPTSFIGGLGVRIGQAALQGGNGALSFGGARVNLFDTTITGAGSGFSVDFATSGLTPQGMWLDSTTITTGGGDIRFGAVQSVTSPQLGASAVGPWIEQADVTAFGPALIIATSLLDAGSGAIRGGGASRQGSDGVDVFGSTLRAARILLAGRADQQTGIALRDSTLVATQQLTLDGRSAGLNAFASGLHVASGTALEVSDPAAGAGSELRLRGENLFGGHGLVVEGGQAASGGAPTVLTAIGAAMTLEGIANGQAGLRLLGDAVIFAPSRPHILAVPAGTSGLTLDGRDATAVTLRGDSGAAGAAGGAPAIEMESVELQAPSVANRPTTLVANGALRVDNALVTGQGPITLQAQGAGINGSLLSLLDTTITTGGALAIDGVASSGGLGVSLLGGNVLSGARVAIAGSGAGAPGVGFSATGGVSSVEATAGNLTVDGGAAASSAPTVALAGGWSLRASDTVSLMTHNALPLVADASGQPTFTAGRAFVLSNDSPAGLVIGGAGAGIDAAALSQALAGMPAASTTTLQVAVGSGALAIDGALAVPSRLALAADRINVGPGGSLTAAGAGDAIVLRGLTTPALAAFTNTSTAGAAALAAPNGRWVLLVDDPLQVALGGLVADFTAFGLAANPFAADAAGNLVTPSAGNVLGFGVAPSALTGSVGDPATASTVHVLDASRFAVSVPMAMSTPTRSRLFDAAVALEGGDGQPAGTLDWSTVSREEAQTLLAARSRFKQKVFAKGVYRLQEDPRLADAPLCTNEAELETGRCLISEELKQRVQAARAAAASAGAPSASSAPGATATPGAPAALPLRPGQRRVIQAELPGIQRKLALLIGVNKYDDSRVPELTGAVPDVRAVRALLEGRLGYEATVLEDAKREDILRAFNRLALQALSGDSVIVYYAGHGVVVPVNGVETGFWLPADVDAELPGTWLSNADIARLVAAVGARQLMLVSDSCYSGTLVGKERVQLGNRALDAEELLRRRAAVVMSSGGDEPVADSGRGGHSIFAWHFMRALESLDRWQPGGNLFERVRDAVVKDFPQTPQYGASRTAGHQGDTDYLFERRALERSRP